MKIILLIACLAIGVCCLRGKCPIYAFFALGYCFSLKNKKEWLLQLVNGRNEWEPDTPRVLENIPNILCIIRAIAVRPKRSMGGTAIPIYQVPYFVSIKHDGKQSCGAAFVSRQHIVTAAHCLYDELHQRYPGVTVVSGVDHKNTRGTTHQIASIVYPPGFNRTTLQDDIAVITLTAPVTWNLNRNLIALPNAEPSYNEKASLIAFKTTVNPTKDAPLQTLEVKMTSIRRCLVNLPDYVPIYGNMFCGTVDEDEAVYMGDSGGPLVHRRRLVGVVSSTGVDTYQYGFFTNVYKFVDFINAAMGQ